MHLLTLFVFLYLSFYTTQAARSYGVVYSDVANYASDVLKKLIPLLGNVSLVDAQSTTPTLGQLSSFDALLVYSDYQFLNPSLLGDTLANYVDLGKGVVLADFSFANSSSYSYSLGGRFAGTSSTTYYVFPPSTYSSSPDLVLVAIDPSHPVLNGVSKFDGGSYSFRSFVNWTANAYKIASWSDQTPLIGSRTIRGARRVDLNFYPVSSDAISGCWVASTDGAKILANSLSWVANTSAPCISFNTCTSCASSDCLWCLDNNQCNTPDFICPNRIARPTDCPIPSCSSLGKCSTCLGSGASCAWCLDNSACVDRNATCRGEINDGRFCSSE